MTFEGLDKPSYAIFLGQRFICQQHKCYITIICDEDHMTFEDLDQSRFAIPPGQRFINNV